MVVVQLVGSDPAVAAAGDELEGSQRLSPSPR